MPLGNAPLLGGYPAAFPQFTDRQAELPTDCFPPFAHAFLSRRQMAFRLTPRLRALSVLSFFGRPDRRRVGLSLCWEVLDDPFHRAVS